MIKPTGARAGQGSDEIGRCDKCGMQYRRAKVGWLYDPMATKTDSRRTVPRERQCDRGGSEY